MVQPTFLPKLTKFVARFGTLPTSYRDAMTYEEQILWICKYMEDTLLPALNQNSEALEELQSLFTALKDYVDNYFEDLDVQEEINNKLDDMAESGQLTDIIAQYLELAGLLCFNTKADMKSAQNLTDGSFVKTFGTLIYNDGYGEFYKIREIQNTDVVDDDNIIALTNYNNLIAEKIPNSNITSINNSINEINTTIDDNKKKKNQKLTCCINTYTADFDLKGQEYGLSFERLGYNGTSFDNQGLCFNNVDGLIYGNDGSHIFKLETTKPTTKTNLFTIDLGHGGDCCIYYKNMYIVDSENNNIHIVNMGNGNDTIINVSDNDIINTNTDGNPVIGGICVLEEDIYIAVIDEGNEHTASATNSTIRIYKYNLTEQIFRKIFETENNLCYLQGMTMDEENFYIAGNKPFTSAYTGNIIYIINKKELRLLDKIQNDFSAEFEGLDYCCIDGIEGLLTTINSYGSFSHLGLYAFYGNTTKQKFYIETANEFKSVCVTRGGLAHIHYEKTDTFTANETYTFPNFLGNTFLGYPVGTGGRRLHGHANGNSRADICTFDYDFMTDSLYLFPATTTAKIYVDFDLIV